MKKKTQFFFLIKFQNFLKKMNKNEIETWFIFSIHFTWIRFVQKLKFFSVIAQIKGCSNYSKSFQTSHWLDFYKQCSETWASIDKFFSYSFYKFQTWLKLFLFFLPLNYYIYTFLLKSCLNYNLKFLTNLIFIDYYFWMFYVIYITYY